jgi:uncharacterized protein
MIGRLRSAVRTAGWPARAVLIIGIRAYRLAFGGWLGGQCRFYPSCSHYAEEAIRSRGAIAGSVASIWRILRCNPFGKGGPDPVSTEAYEVIIPSEALETRTGGAD